MMRPAWVLVGVCGLGVMLGWWLMGRLVRSEDDRPPLIPRIQSLPAFQALPALAAGKRDLIDALESPGGPVWVLLGPADSAGSSALVCGFPRASAGAIAPPDCFPVTPELEARFRSARFAVGGQEPIVVVPEPGATHGMAALNARSGERIPVEEVPTGISPRVERGTRLVRTFRADAATRLVMSSPHEASYTGPVSGYAATRAPAPSADDTATSVSSCVTPAGYIQAREEAPGTGVLRSDRPVHVSFFSRGDMIAETESRVPNAPVIAAPFACDATHGLFTWMSRGGSVSELSCSPESCVPTTAKQSDIDDDDVLALGRAGSSIVLLWRNARGEPLVRLGPMSSFAHSPTAPLWKADASEWQLVKVLSTGQSLLVLVQGKSLKAIQIHADGKLEALAPRAGAG